MRWPRWLPGVLAQADTEVGQADATGAHLPGPPDGVDAVRPMGTCEFCGSPISVRSRTAVYRGRVDCTCGHRNQVQFRQVRMPDGIVSQHVSVTRRHRFAAVVRDPDMRLGFRYGLCPTCSFAVRLLDAHVISRADSTGSEETFTYYCPTCHLHDDVRRGQLVGHHGQQIVDTLRRQLPPGIV